MGGDGWWVVAGFYEIKANLNSVEVVVEVIVELGNIESFSKLLCNYGPK